MELAVAIGLIEKGIDRGGEPQLWAELGAGKGLFTRALSTLLPAGSTIHAMDIDNTALKSMALEVDTITLVKSKIDFVRDPLPIKNVDGLLLANAIHFAPNKIQLAKNLKKSLKEGGKLILVEYDTDTANAWVPYPVSFKSLKEIYTSMGFQVLTKLHEAPSIYHRANIYAAVLS